MLIFEQPLINAEDYLAIISGVSADDVLGRFPGSTLNIRREGLIRYRTLASEAPLVSLGGDVSSGVESLYLKITLFSEILQKVGDDLFHMTARDLGCTAECVWLRLHPPPSAVPLNWMFAVSGIDGASESVSIAGDDRNVEPPHYGWHALGMLFLDILMANGGQRPEKPWSDWRDADRASLSPDGIAAAVAGITACCGGDVFPEVESIAYSLVSFGNDLRRDVRNGDHIEFNREISSRLAKIRSSALSMMLQTASPRTVVSTVPESEADRNGEILGILRNIRNQWRQGTVSGFSAESDADNEIPKTVILKPGGTILQKSMNDAMDGASTEYPLDGDTGSREEALPETVILKPAAKREPSSESQSPDNAGMQLVPEVHEDDLPETVVIGRPDGEQSARRTASVVPSESPETPDGWGDDLPETIVIVRPGSGQGIRKSAPAAPPEPPRAPDARDDDLPETVILSGGKNASEINLSPDAAEKPAKEENRSEAPADDDLLTETVILRPDNSTHRNRSS